MAIYIVQHGKCFSKDVDPERSLSEEGITTVKRIASVAGGYGVKPSVINHSGKKRALETAEIISEALSPEAGIQKISGINPMDDVRIFSEHLNVEQNEMFVGHLPFMEHLISFLIAGDIAKPVFKLQNGGILCMDKEPGNGQWFIKWGLMPEIR
ncbi:MAG: phosphohistidine phosphatase SixA [Proteobacteria bacterium]|nr:phosphohistidine phosphatase SixA [Pseudomonadota bacterium]